MSTLTNFEHDSVLDLDPWVGQRSVSYRFERINSATGGPLGALIPLRDFSLSHTAGATIARNLSLSLGAVDTANVDPIAERLDMYMVFPSVEYPLGRFVYTDETKSRWTAGDLASVSLVDEMFIVDQPMTEGFNAHGKSCLAAIQEIMDPFPFELNMEASPYTSVESWGIGTNRGSALQALALSGDYFPPWFGNDKTLHFIRSFDPAAKIPDFDWDTNNVVVRAGISETSDILTAPNKFIVVSNAATNTSAEAVGTASIPATAPHSAVNRGFEVIQVSNLQIADGPQAQAVAENLAQQQTVYERVQLTTAPDPRFDSYNVVRWQGELWLEISWTLQGNKMNHTLRKSYS